MIVNKTDIIDTVPSTIGETDQLSCRLLNLLFNNQEQYNHWDLVDNNLKFIGTGPRSGYFSKKITGIKIKSTEYNDIWRAVKFNKQNQIDLEVIHKKMDEIENLVIERRIAEQETRERTALINQRVNLVREEAQNISDKICINKNYEEDSVNISLNKLSPEKSLELLQHLRNFNFNEENNND